MHDQLLCRWKSTIRVHGRRRQCGRERNAGAYQQLKLHLVHAMTSVRRVQGLRPGRSRIVSRDLLQAGLIVWRQSPAMALTVHQQNRCFPNVVCDRVFDVGKQSGARSFRVQAYLERPLFEAEICGCAKQRRSGFQALVEHAVGKLVLASVDLGAKYGTGLLACSGVPRAATIASPIQWVVTPRETQMPA